MDDFAGARLLRGQDGTTSVHSESRVLALGDISEWIRSGRGLQPSADLCLGDLDALSEDLLSNMRPRLILSPVVTPRFDCLDVAHRLIGLNYTGKYRAVAQNLPKPHLVRREVLRECPGLDFDVVVFSALEERMS